MRKLFQEIYSKKQYSINLVDTLEYFLGDGSYFYAVIRCPRVSHGAPQERPSRPRSYISATNSSKGVWQEWQESLKGLTVSKKNVGCLTIVLEENVSLTTSRLSHKDGLQESCENAFHGRECSHKSRMFSNMFPQVSRSVFQARSVLE